MLFEMIPIKSIAIIIDIAGYSPADDGKNIIEHVKTGVIAALTKLEGDDQVYVFDEFGDLAMAATIAEAVSIVNNYQYVRINVPIAIEESCFLTGQYDNSHRAVFYITDNYKDFNDGLLLEAVNAGVSRDPECQFYVYGLGAGYSTTLKDLFNVNYHFRDVRNASRFAEMFDKDLTR